MSTADSAVLSDKVRQAFSPIYYTHFFYGFIVVPPPCGGWELYFIIRHPHAYAWGYNMSPSARAEQ